MPFIKTVYREEDLVYVTAEGVAKRSDVSFVKELKVPPNTAFSNSNNCNVLQVSYVVTVEAQISGFRRNIEVSVPIRIGSIPLQLGPQVHQHTTSSSAPLMDFSMEYPGNFNSLS